MTHRKLIMGACALMVLTGACSSGSTDNEPTGRGVLTLSLLPNTSYTRAVNEATYTNVNNYTIDLYKGNTLVWTKSYADVALKQEVDAGSYRLVAHCGQNVNAGFDALYVEGSTQFDIATGRTKVVDVACVPANAKIVIQTSDDFSRYFTDYQVAISSDYLTQPFTYSQSDVTAGHNAYVKVAPEGSEVTVALTLTAAEGISINGRSNEFTYTVNPRDCMIFTLTPEVTEAETGTISGIKVTIDTSTTDENIDIVIPEDML
jgi:hypothetical protein